MTIPKERLREMFYNCEIGVSGHSDPISADYVLCPSCYNKQEIAGFAMGVEHITSMPHKPGCRLFSLYEDCLDE